jgi:2-polyprenyl-3-methyl-5-hydroxy-6-metoxy-1,4-benzoquinol methylase
MMNIAQVYGYIFVGLFGYPLNFITRMRARTVLSYLPKSGGKLLEIGSSFGVLAFELARRGFQVTGLDVNPQTIKLANKINEILNLKNVQFATRDLINNPFPAGEFDVVVTVEVLEHIKDDAGAIREIHRILREGGLLIVSIPYAETAEPCSTPLPSARNFEGTDVLLDVPGELHFRHGYNPEDLSSLLTSNGFRVVRWSWTNTVNILPQSMILFPFCYIPAMILSKFNKQRCKLTMLAKKEPMEAIHKS